MAKPEIVRRVNALLALAADKGATEEERRTAAATAARLMREHGLTVGGAPEPEPSPATDEGELVRVRVQAVVGGVKSVIDVVSSGLGFDVASFAQELLRERVQGAMQSAIRAPAVRPRARKRRVTK